MAEHIQVKHTNCENLYCPICEGGLFVCEVCGGLEGGVPTECPGEQMSPEFQHELVYGGILDFRGGKWIFGSNLELQGWRKPTSTGDKMRRLEEVMPKITKPRDLEIVNTVRRNAVNAVMAFVNGVEE